MSTYRHKLAPAPSDATARRLWLQHVAGFILFEDAHRYAVSRLPSSLNDAAKETAMKAIDDTLYGVMMIIEGVTGALGNSQHTVDLHLVVRLCDAGSGEPIEELNLRDGDGACMGFHGWREGDFGKAPVVA